MTPAEIFTLKELSGKFYNAESTRDKMLEIGPNLKRSRTVFKGTKQILAPRLMLYDEKISSYTNNA